MKYITIMLGAVLFTSCGSSGGGGGNGTAPQGQGAPAGEAEAATHPKCDQAWEWTLSQYQHYQYAKYQFTEVDLLTGATESWTKSTEVTAIDPNFVEFRMTWKEVDTTSRYTKEAFCQSVAELNPVEGVDEDSDDTSSTDSPDWDTETRTSITVKAGTFQVNYKHRQWESPSGEINENQNWDHANGEIIKSVEIYDGKKTTEELVEFRGNMDEYMKGAQP